MIRLLAGFPRWCLRRTATSCNRRDRPLRRSVPLCLEPLEDRVTPSGNPLVEMPVIKSVNGVLTATLVEQQGNTIINGQTWSNAETYNGDFPGPTLEANPGDVMNITIVNQLSNPTNLHVHGLHVSPTGNSDNVLLEIMPGQQNTYHIQIPTDQPQGLYWYHPHHHMFVDSQVLSGLSGLLVIGHPDGGAPELSSLTEHLLAIKNVLPNTMSPNTIDPGPESLTSPTIELHTVDGQINPTITMAPGESQIWNLANIATAPTYNISLPGHTLYVVAEDGNPYQAPIAVSSLILEPGKRYSVLIQEPATTLPGTTYALTASSFFQGVAVFPAGAQTSLGGPQPSPPVTLATLQIQGTPVTPFVVPLKLTPPGSFVDYRTLPVDQSRTVLFTQDATLPTPEFMINNALFPNNLLYQPRLDTVEEWTLVNNTVEIHPFHIHVNNFQLVAVNGKPLPMGGQVTVTGQGTDPESYLAGGNADIVDIPAGGSVTIRMRYEDFLGEYVYHCHILFHEDHGMMSLVNVVPHDPVAVVGADAGGGPAVKTYSSVTGQQEMNFFAYPPSFGGGVRVATGNLQGNGVPDIVCAPGPGGGPDIRVFDGTTGQLRLEFFAFGAAFTGGCFVTTGDVTGQGYDDIIVSADAGGGPAVAVFDGKTGQPIYSFFAFDPRFTGGVRIAAGDIAGDGRTDIACGAGAGGGPYVALFELAPAMDGSNTLQLQSRADFFAFDPSFTGGVYVACGNNTAHGFWDLVVSAGAGGGPQVNVYAMDTSNMNMNADGSMPPEMPFSLVLVTSFLAFDPAFVGGVRVGTTYNTDGNGDNILASAGSGGAQVNIFADQTYAPMQTVVPFGPGFTGGLYVSGSG